MGDSYCETNTGFAPHLSSTYNPGPSLQNNTSISQTHRFVPLIFRVWGLYCTISHDSLLGSRTPRTSWACGHKLHLAFPVRGAFRLDWPVSPTQRDELAPERSGEWPMPASRAARPCRIVTGRGKWRHHWGRWRSRVRNLPEFLGAIPSSA